MLKSSLSERDNPFRPGGTLDRESLEMIRSSTFSRSEVIIKDPAASRANSIVETSYLLDDGPVKPHKAVLVHFQSPIKSSPHVPPRRTCSNRSDDEDEDDDDDDYEGDDTNDVFVHNPLDNNNHNNHFDHKSPNRVNPTHSPSRLNGKATHTGGGGGTGDGGTTTKPLEDEVRAETMRPGETLSTGMTGSGVSIGGDSSGAPVHVEHVRLTKRRKCCHVM